MAGTFAVANRFLTLAKENDDTLTPMQLLKLVYIAHGWMLGLYGRPLIHDEIEAWQYGPVIPKLYDAVRVYKSNPVGDIAVIDGDKILDEKESSIIEQVYKIYGSLSGPALSRLTHAKDTPWEITSKLKGFWGAISNDIIEDHYQRLAAQRGAIDASK